jgi:hypothetical protein
MGGGFFMRLPDKYHMRFRQFLIIESKQELVRLGYPEVVAKVLHKHFGKNAYLIGKWFISYRFGDREVPENWWLQITSNFRQHISLYDLTYLHDSTSSAEEYVKALKKLDLRTDEGEVYDDDYLHRQREALADEIEEQFLQETYFSNTIIQAIKDGKLTDVAPYRNMPFWSAQEAYDKKKVFEDAKPLKAYPNGYRWIDAGNRCHLVGSQMKHCGSVGVMGMDKDRTMLVLFGPENKAHVTVTYSPNEKRISGDVGVGSSAVKSKYHDYILDLSQMLGARFDADQSKSKLLSLKYLLKDKADQVEPLDDLSSTWDEFFRVVIGGQEYYTNSHVVVSGQDLAKFQQAVSQGTIELKNNGKNPMVNLFHYLNQDLLGRQLGIQYVPLKTFVGQ